MEDILVAWLEGKGYVVTKRVRVQNGIIDLVATGPDGRWVIEAKGEDRGGYTSAEMNFQMGLGQILSRMAEPAEHYALAIPLTSDFCRVLYKFRGSPGFAKLGLSLFVVEESCAVHRIPPTSMAMFLKSVSN